MTETSLLNEYRKLLPDVTKIFVVPEIPDVNRDTSYLNQFYKEFLTSSAPVAIESFFAGSLPKIILSRLKSEKTILHYHWLEFEDLKTFLGIIWKFFWIILYKFSGGRLVWSVHNRYPHHNKYVSLNKKIRRIFAGLADKLHISCETAIDAVLPVLDTERSKFFITGHPYFPADIFGKEKAVDELSKRYLKYQLDKDDKIFLMFGAIAEYKGIREVIDIFRLFDDKNKLIIAGFVKRGNKKYFDELKPLADNKQIFIEGRLIPDNDVPYFFNSADCVIFNYRDILTSGGVYLALSYGKKVIAPGSGCLTELKSNLLIFFDISGNRKENLKIALKEFIR